MLPPDGHGVAGKVALVTGAGRGIGAAVARTLSQAGAAVAGLDLSPEAHGPGSPAVCHRADVSDPAEVERVVDGVERELGPIDILVNVAGVFRTGPVTDLTDEDWASVFAVNTAGVFHTCRAVAKGMIARRSGAIVTVASNAGGVPRMGMAAYAASKAAAVMFTRCLGLELAEHGIRCNVVSPGSTRTAMQATLDPHSVLDGDLASYRNGIPLRRIADPADIADVVLFLVSDRARHITMQDLYVDGGAALRA
ncbi:2,3-dihydro-2,3-dihydroxybenzoate dehydrogenase [Sinosporangium album]|uniref:2,3-dihydro-2,3-dihydroxybenzoate dehydrogenase n=1 Tax=Sinosporangium album TaxID=504805 RepID=A0A1G8HNH9_9ACTN|nr:2,3-dihydro-2,3-dihydroxybenzoate dehydrogenase [Sinosporangium album]SDI08060.1 2,3-dihydro-2,3-dihydroxybenzoate dehydrogenase [Sinosporangium album]